MNKKIICLLLSLILALSCMACGTGTNSGTETENQTETQIETETQVEDFTGKLDFAENCMFSIHVKINPEYEIFVDDAGIIFEVEFINDDAKTLFAGMDLLGIPFADGFRQLLDRVYESDRLHKGDKVEISTFVKNINITQGWTNIVLGVIDEFNQNTGMGIEPVYCGETFVGNPEENNQGQTGNQNGNENQGNEDERYTEVERDQDGNLVRTLEGDRNDQYIETFYKNGLMEHQEIRDSAGNMIFLYFNEKQAIVREEVHATDGSKSITEYDDNGNVVKEEHYDPQGNLVVQGGNQGGNQSGNQNGNQSGNQNNNNNNNNNSGSSNQGTLVGSERQEGDYLVVTLGKDNWMKYFEDYTDVLFWQNDDRIIIRRYFMVKSSLGTVDESRSYVEFKYIAEEMDTQCTIDLTNKVLTNGAVTGTGRYVYSDVCHMGIALLDGTVIGYGVSCSATEINSSYTKWNLPAVIDMEYIQGTLYIKNK